MHICGKANDYALIALLQGRKVVQRTAEKLDIKGELAGKYIEGWAASNAMNFETALLRPAILLAMLLMLVL